ncbi:hypothetical protein QVG61_08260 [Thiohalobacter sp. IOR34]|uniref:hypothetical protein n=1 Tax=Thiohalobacter sp. IOR34 TaxID=3057176 RepID=UPI0025B10B59|nr:hypothetical protein [Thiohalobacter sp. IOR34]WJW74505.1 hypothetical protein QVG61_08260 [Thiohalobacter sp. IOR34]
MRNIGWLPGLLLLMSPPLLAADSLQAIKLIYQEQEEGTAVYPVRILVTPGFLRIDEGEDGGDFVLLDRAKRTVYSVAQDNASILVIRDSEVDGRQAPAIAVERQVETAAPRIAGRAVSSVAVRAGGELCMTASVVPGLLPEAAAALAEYQHVLAARQFRDLEMTPSAQRTPCFLANYVYANARHLELGLPVQEQVRNGRRRLLMDFDARAEVDAGLFELPPGLQRIELR